MGGAAMRRGKDPSELYSDPACIWIDVRQKFEHDKDKLTTPHIHCPVMPFQTAELLKRVQQEVPNKSTPIIIFCDSGNRSGMGKKALEKIGYNNIANGVLDKIRPLAQVSVAQISAPMDLTAEPAHMDHIEEM
jgi:rhodanese-related sulfurtransferase